MPGIKETTDLVVVADVAADDAVLATADGRITLLDARYFLNLVAPVKEAAENIGDVPAELGDLSREEAVELAQRSVGVIYKFAKAISQLMAKPAA